MISTSQRRRAVILGLLVVSTTGALGTPPAVAAPAPCRVTNLTAGGEHYRGDGDALATAIDEADPRSTLAIRGLCVGTFAVAKELTLVGKESTIIAVPTLDGNDEGTVLTIEAGVTVRDLRIRDGRAVLGGGIYNAGRLVLRGTSLVFGNVAVSGSGSGGGIFNEGRLVLRGDSQVRDNQAKWGGGIYHLGGSLFLTGSSAVRGNRAGLGGGGVFHEFDDVVMTRHASVRGNVAGDYGGGIFGSGFMGDIIILRRAASVIGNTAGISGGGIYLPGQLHNLVYVCSSHVRISPNDPNDPPATGRCSDLNL